MLKKFPFIILIVVTNAGIAQKLPQKKLLPDTSIANYDELFSEVDDFMNAVFESKNMFLINMYAAQQFFNYQTTDTIELNSRKKFSLTPSVAFFHKSGAGISTAVSIINENKRINAYQFSATLSYDYLKNYNFATGVSFTRYITNDSLPFYTTPLENVLNGYFLYKDAWLKPYVSISYGWGSKGDYEERKEEIIKLQKRGKKNLIANNPASAGNLVNIVNGILGLNTGSGNPGTPNQTNTTINTTESIADLSIATSVRHDFYLASFLKQTASFRLSPQITFTSGTQKFGFNQTSNTYLINKNNTSVLNNSENVQLDGRTKFQPLSLSALIKSSVSYRNFFFQPQILVDYYFPAPDHNLITLFGINTGYIF
jgi:hypothetical protein